MVKMLGDIERSISVLGRRGIIFNEFVESYYNGEKLPENFIHVGSESEFYYDKGEFEKRRAELEEAETLRGESDGIIAEEMHEVKRANEINTILKEKYSLDLKDFLLKQQRKVSGEKVATKFLLTNGQDEYEVASLGDICSSMRQIGGKGIEIKRFKGLGEMNADQLWDTTMNPAKRTLLKVTLEDAGEADRLFSILMGEDVEKRRNFIQEHALEVQNLDV
jgi:DNA gyrase subunit B